MTKDLAVIAYGLDYLRFRIFQEADVEYFARELPYVELADRWFHGSRFIDITGKNLEILRMLDDAQNVVLGFASMYPLHRLDVFVDVLGDALPMVKTQGTMIANGSRIETKYSHHLKRRGNLQAFGRVYDAKAAGHYEIDVTRFEIEYKREAARALLGKTGWKRNPVCVALSSISEFFSVDLAIENLQAVELNAPKRRYSYDRERFYARYGRNIVGDIQEMGVQSFYDYVWNCIQDIKEDINDEILSQAE